MNMNEYINKLWSSLLADDVPSDFGNVTYYGLLKDTLLLFKKLNEEWEIKKVGFNEQIDSAVKILNSAIELLNSVDTSVDELNAKYSEFVNTVNTEIAKFEKETNDKIDALSTNINETISEYVNSPEFEELLTAKVDEILQGVGFEELVQKIIAKTTIGFSNVNTSGINSPSFINAMASNNGLLRKNSINTFRTMEANLIFNNNISVDMKLTTGVILSLMLISSNNTFIIGNSGIAMRLNSNIRPIIYVGNSPHYVAYLDEVNNCINKENPSIPVTSMFKIGERTVVQTNGGNTNVTLGDFDYPLYLAVKDINTRPKMVTKSGTSFELSIKNDVTSEVTKQVNSLLNKIYHVGRIIETLDPEFNPNTIIGEWEPFGGGRVTVGVDVNNPIMNEAGKTFGENEHTLTINEMPSHGHAQFVTAKSSQTTGIRVDYNEDSASGAYEQGINTGNTGGGQPHNNMQASVSVYRWIRIS